MSEARHTLERLVNGEEGRHFRSADTGFRTFRGRHQLALLYAKLGDVPHAVAELESITREWPGYAAAARDLANLIPESRR
jgi:hypothetical protein